jgi:hypothetical protein
LALPKVEESIFPEPETDPLPEPAAEEAGEPEALPPLQQEEAPLKKVSPPTSPKVAGVQLQRLKAEESKDTAKEQKEKRKKRKEASKRDSADRTNDGSSARHLLLGAQVVTEGPSARGQALESEQACAIPDGTGTVTTEEASDTVTSEGLYSSCARVYGTAWEPAAEEPCGTETEQACVWRAEEQEQSKDELVTTSSDEWHSTPSKEASVTLSYNDVEEDVNESGSTMFFDLAAADREMPALAAEFTAQLVQADLGNFAEPLARLGVEAARDVGFLSDKELVRMGMRLVQRRKLRAISAGKEEEEEDGEELHDGDDVETVRKANIDSAADDGCYSEVSTAALDFDRISSEAEANALGEHAKVEA